MKTLYFLLCVFFFWGAHAQNVFHPDKTQEMLEFQEAQKQFNPWYSGPLLPGGAHMMPPGNISIQTYLFMADNYAMFNNRGHSRNIEDLVQFNPQINALQVGLTSWLDASLAFQAFANWETQESSGGIGDTAFILGFPILKESPDLPAMKIGVGEIFPTGRYEKFTSNKTAVQATGQGSCLTVLSFRAAKMFLWTTPRPVNIRATFTYTIPTTFMVHGFNYYGGGFDTYGKVRPGNQFSITTAIEWLFTPKWVLLNDFVYLYNNRSKFDGRPGVSLDGSPPVVERKSNYIFSLAPAIEYNPSKRLKFISSFWFTVMGRNSYDFFQGIFGITYTWPV